MREKPPSEIDDVAGTRRSTRRRVAALVLLGASAALNAALVLVWATGGLDGKDSPDSGASPEDSRHGGDGLDANARLRGGLVDRKLESLRGRGVLTADEVASIRIAEANERFREQVDRFREINDPWLTADELLSVEADRIAAIRDAEGIRRDEIESAAGGDWAVAEATRHPAMNKLAVFHYALVRRATDDAVKLPDANAIVIRLARDGILAKLSPGSVKTQEIAGTLDVLCRSAEADLKSVLGESGYRAIARGITSVEVEDVWSLDERFGTALTTPQRDAVLDAIIPDNPLRWVFDESIERSSHNLPPASLSRIRGIVGDAAFGHLLKFQREWLLPDEAAPWTPEIHVAVYDLEEAYRSEVDEIARAQLAPTALDEAIELLRSRYRERVAAASGDRADAYLASPDGAWLAKDEDEK